MPTHVTTIHYQTQQNGVKGCIVLIAIDVHSLCTAHFHISVDSSLKATTSGEAIFFKNCHVASVSNTQLSQAALWTDTRSFA